MMNDHLYLMGEIGTPFKREWIFPLGTTTLEGRTLPAPANTDKFLAATYGPHWLVPDPAFHFETPRSTHRRLNGWFRGTRVHREEWDRQWSTAHRRRTPKVRPSRFAAWVRRQQPDLAEVVTLPNASQGYRRKAQAMLEPTNRLTATIGGQAVDLPYAAATSGAWGALAPTAGTTPTAVAVRRVSAAANPAWPAATPAMGCGTLSGLTGAIAVIDRGECSLADKVLNAQNAGAKGAILANNLGREVGNSMGPGVVGAQVTIPSVMIGESNGARIKQALTQGTVNLTLEILPVPSRDSDFDAGVIAHEYGHGISNRLIGGPTSIAFTCLSCRRRRGKEAGR